MRGNGKVRNGVMSSARNGRLKNNETIKNVRASADAKFFRLSWLLICLLDPINLSDQLKSVLLSPNACITNAEVCK